MTVKYIFYVKLPTMLQTMQQGFVAKTVRWNLATEEHIWFGKQKKNSKIVTFAFCSIFIYLYE